MEPKASRPLAIVTGGSRGIGAATALVLGDAGYDVMLTYNFSGFEAEEIVSKLRAKGGDAVAVKVDCTNVGEVVLLSKHPWCSRGISALILNHGQYIRKPANKTTPEDIIETMSVNFSSAHLVWWHTKNKMKRNSSIVVIGSQLAIKGSEQGADYAASKAALTTWARSLSLDVANQNIRVNIIAPGYVDTDILKNDTKQKRESRINEVPLKRLAEPKEIGKVAAFLCSEAASYITGSIIHVNGGLYRP